MCRFLCSRWPGSPCACLVRCLRKVCQDLDGSHSSNFQHILDCVSSKSIFHRCYSSLVYDSSTRLCLHSRCAMVFMISTTIFVWRFPTLRNTITRYSTNAKAFVTDTGGYLQLFDSFQYLVYMVHRGWRINRIGEFAVVWSENSSSMHTTILRQEASLTDDF